ncbi:LLM class F420-dependent oxidoreductase [Actinosynnema sp. CA-248983]
MKYSLFLPTGFGQDLVGIPDPSEAFETIVAIAKAADDSGYHSLWAPDHFHTVPPSQASFFEVWSTLTALARETTNVRLGPMVTGNDYRNPALQAKMASTVDVLAHGRLTFGIGGGWYEADYVGYGYEYPTTGERLRRLREAVQVIRAMWTEQEATFEGKHYQVNSAINQPKGVQTPHIPLLVAGSGEKVTLRIVAEFADQCNVIEAPDGIARKLDILRSHCEDVGRDYDSIWKTTTTHCIIRDTDAEARAAIPVWAPDNYPGDLAEYGLIGTLDTIRERIAAYEAVGVQELAISFEDPTRLDVIRELATAFTS